MNIPAIQRFKDKLIAGQFCFGPAISFSDPLVSAALGETADFLWIDGEHAAMSMEAVHGHILAARSTGIPALVRVPGSGMRFIKPVLDAGADGVIVPQIYGAAEARQVATDSRYPPLGTRGFGPRVPSNFDRIGSKDYVERANSNVFVCVQIETAEALAEIDAIVAVPGIDAVVIGPWDLSGALGVLGQPEHPRVVEAIELVASKARAAGKFVGAGGAADVGFATRMAKRGVQWLQWGGDYSYMVSYFDHGAQQIRDALR
jgi:2-keto-3-deoxy-L-rhamnonate aldolase RhmA